MNAAILTNKIIALESALDSLESWLAFWTAMVVLGLIVEYAIPIKELILERPFSWKLFREAVGGLLITGGVAGELIIGFRASTVSTDLRSANGELIALLQKDAKDAEERIATATKEAKEAGARALQFEAQIFSANVRAKEAEARAAEAQLELAKFKAPRTLSPEQQRRLVAKMKKFAGQKFAAFVTPIREATNLLDTLGKVLTSSGWIIEPTNTPIVIGKAGIMLVNGVKVQVAPSRVEDLGKVSTALADALNSENIETKTEVSGQLEKTPDVINLIVGDKS